MAGRCWIPRVRCSAAAHSADCEGVHGNVTFAEVLDETLSGYQPAPAAAYHPRGNQTAPLHPFLFNRIDVPAPSDLFRACDHDVTASRIGTMRPTGARARATGDQRAVSAPPVDATPVAETPRTIPVRTPARPGRRLTVVQRRSLEALIGFGAAIHSDFSAGQLRSAFRTLALQYHPDRHPFADNSEQAALARHFSAITASYETLLTALESPPS
jgi:hypothetical protein